MARRISLTAIITFAFFASGAARAATGVDHGTVHAPPPAGAPRIVVDEFDASGADLGAGGASGKPKNQVAAHVMQDDAPAMLARLLADQLEVRHVLGGGMQAGGEIPEAALHLQGRFTVLNPGSKSKRVWVGMGAGRSRVCVEGELVDAEGKRLLTFDHCRSGTGTYTFTGGDSTALMSVDIEATADKIAAFIEAWSKGER